MPLINKPILKDKKKRKYSNKHDIINNKYVYNTRTWRLLRITYLSNNPLCSRCLAKGKIKSAVEVHHIIPISSTDNIQEKKALGFNYKNLKSLCKECHKEIHNPVFIKK